MVPFLRAGCVIGATSIGPEGGSRRYNGEGVCGVGRTGECGGRSLVSNATFFGVSGTVVSGLPRGSTDSGEGCGAAEGTAILEDLCVGVSRDGGVTDARGTPDVRPVVVQESIVGSFGGIKAIDS
jgi:hypothetical protein